MGLLRGNPQNEIEGDWSKKLKWEWIGFHENDQTIFAQTSQVERAGKCPQDAVLVHLMSGDNKLKAGIRA